VVADENVRLLWERGSTLRVCFCDGDRGLQKRVADIARQWTEHANLRFVFLDWMGFLEKQSDEVKRLKDRRLTTDEQIRKSLWFRFRAAGPLDPHIAITFKGKGFNSAIAKHSLEWIREGQHSMRLGGLEKITDDREFRRIVLHEFGHALGLEHEHQNPEAGFKWNVPYIEAWFADRNNVDPTWTRDEVRDHVLTPIQSNSSNHGKFDRDSIMLYTFPPEFTTDRISTPRNTELSAGDKAAASRLYPKGK
jgi:hypothetical protein